MDWEKLRKSSWQCSRRFETHISPIHNHYSLSQRVRWVMRRTGAYKWRQKVERNKQKRQKILGGVGWEIGARLSQSVQRPAIGCTVRGPEPGFMQGILSSPRPCRPTLGPTGLLLYKKHRGSFRWVKRPRTGVNHPFHLAPGLRKAIPTSILPLWLQVTLKGELCI